MGLIILEKLLQQIEESKKIIALERDSLRDILSELESIVDSLERGTENIDSGMREIKDGIDAISEYL
jgi:exonuclease VII small subunit